MSTASQLVDLNRFPLLTLDNPPALRQINTWQQQLRDDGVCVLERFVRDDALPSLIAEANELASAAFHSTVTGNAYLEPLDPTLPAGHPKLRTETTSLGVIAYDQFSDQSAIRRLYEWPILTELVRRILNLPQLFHYDCPLGALNLSVMKENDYLRWHFDQSDFVVSMPLQEAERGGRFEHVTSIRSSVDEQFARVSRLLDGDRTDVQTLEAPLGSLILFRGKHTIHRVTRIDGQRARLYLLLGYAESTGVRSSDYLKRIRYGRT
jgi:hypothetical protein